MSQKRPSIYGALLVVRLYCVRIVYICVYACMHACIRIYTPLLTSLKSLFLLFLKQSLYILRLVEILVRERGDPRASPCNALKMSFFILLTQSLYILRPV